MMPDPSKNRRHMKILKAHIIFSFEKLPAVNHNGVYRCNNQDHSMLSAWLAAKNIVGENYSIWDINRERLYYENFADQDWSTLKWRNRMFVTGRSLSQTV